MEQGDYVAAQSGLADLLAALDLPTPMRETVLATGGIRLLAADTQNFAARSELRGVQSDLFQMLPFTD